MYLKERYGEARKKHVKDGMKKEMKTGVNFPLVLSMQTCSLHSPGTYRLLRRYASVLYHEGQAWVW
jgi:hypothetical protein